MTSLDSNASHQITLFTMILTERRNLKSQIKNSKNFSNKKSTVKKTFKCLFDNKIDFLQSIAMWKFNDVESTSTEYACNCEPYTKLTSKISKE